MATKKPTTEIPEVPEVPEVPESKPNSKEEAPAWAKKLLEGMETLLTPQGEKRQKPNPAEQIQEIPKPPVVVVEKEEDLLDQQPEQQQETFLQRVWNWFR